MSALDQLSERELVSELDDVEHAIACSSTYERYADGTGRLRMRVSEELLALVEREQSVITEVHRRRRAPVTA